MSARVIFFRVAAHGPSPREAVITGFAGIAYDVDEHRAVEEFSMHVQPDAEGANGARTEIASFLRQHGTITRARNRAGVTQRIARLAGEGVAKFDYPHLRGWYESSQEYLPVDPFVLDLAQIEAFLRPYWSATTPYESMLPKASPDNLLEKCRKDLAKAVRLWNLDIAEKEAFG